MIDGRIAPLDENETLTIINAQKTARPRDFGIDLARVVATALVVLLHVSGRYFGAFGPNWMAANIYDSLSRLSVPLFFMISGALLIPRQDSLNAVIRRFAKLTLLLIFWSFVYLFFFYLTAPNWLAGGSWQILKSPVVVHFWFLYALLGLYLFLPVLQAFYRAASPQAHLFYLGLTFLGASVLPFLQALGIQNPIGIDLRYFPIYAGYMMMGAVLLETVPSPRLATCLGLAAISAGLGTAALTSWISAKTGQPSEVFYVYEAPLTVIATVCGFLCLRGLGAASPGKLCRTIIEQLAPLSFGIYVLHFIPIYYAISKAVPDPKSNAWMTIPVMTFGVFVITTWIVFPFRHTRVGRLLIHAS